MADLSVCLSYLVFGKRGAAQHQRGRELKLGTKGWGVKKYIKKQNKGKNEEELLCLRYRVRSRRGV